MPRTVRYSDELTEVREGDRVEHRGVLRFWRWHPARVNYVPGVSRLHPQLEHNGLQWVGLHRDDGTQSGELVDPQTRCLSPKVRFVGRADGPPVPTPHDVPESDW